MKRWIRATEEFDEDEVLYDEISRCDFDFLYDEKYNKFKIELAIGSLRELGIEPFDSADDILYADATSDYPEYEAKGLDVATARFDFQWNYEDGIDYDVIEHQLKKEIERLGYKLLNIDFASTEE